MASTNLERIRSVVEAVAAQNLPRLLELTDPEVEWQSVFAQVSDGGIYRGHEGIRQYMRDLADSSDVLQARLDGAMVVGSTVVAVGALRYRGRESGVETETEIGYVVRFRDSRVVRLRAFRDPEAAFGAVGQAP